MCDTLDRVATKGLTEKVTFELRPAEGEGANPLDILRKSRETTGAEALRQKCTLCVGETGRSAS